MFSGERERPTFFFRRLRGPSSSGGYEVATERVREREKEGVGEREKKRESYCISPFYLF